MRILLLAVLLWPGHTEKIDARLDVNGQFIGEWEKDFPADHIIACDLHSKHGAKLAGWSKEGYHLTGHPGEHVTGKCR